MFPRGRLRHIQRLRKLTALRRLLFKYPKFQNQNVTSKRAILWYKATRQCYSPPISYSLTRASTVFDHYKSQRSKTTVLTSRRAALLSGASDQNTHTKTGVHIPMVALQVKINNILFFFIFFTPSTKLHYPGKGSPPPPKKRWQYSQTPTHTYTSRNKMKSLLRPK